MNTQILPSANAADRRVSVRDAVVALLRAFGIRHVFGNPGSTELPLLRDFPEDFRYVLGLHEAVVVGMADGYAQATGNATFVNLHSAAGLGNAMGNLFTAFKNRTPMIVTAGQQARSLLPFDPYLGAMQATELPKPYVKWSIEPARAEDVPLALVRAYHVAMQEPRGPVFVSIPVDDWDRLTDPVEAVDVCTLVRPDSDALARLGDALDRCERPAFVVGAAVDQGDAWDAMVALAERHNARVFAAPMSARCSFPENHRLFAGFLAPMRERIVQALSGHDFVFAVGAPAFIYHVEGSGPHVPPGTTLCQLVDDVTVAAVSPSGMSVVGNVRLGLLELLARSATPLRALPQARAPLPRAEPSARMTPAFALQTLADVRDAEHIVVEESPGSRRTMQGYLPFTEPHTFYTMASGGLGYGMPAAVGVALASPGKKVICLIGDGSSMYSIQSMWSAAQLGLPVTFVVMNNGRYEALRDLALLFGFDKTDAVQGTALPDLDFVGLARSMGCRAVKVEHAESLADVLKTALAEETANLVEVIVS
ncbi:benzoylformate decarboxylase [Pandoraea cepalis]|uniref:Benzoylformate decarboxylase n=1 Tax=Pandoraea cepalis TaxID=2508294 RepID=A0AAW7MQN5_9BURK|nr:benzoylformate decarboxylase [Pandoraea cepalis]MDN4574896.1 benzoylformate decarboxylase [Pandoraea cepalis]MDN4578966.1 benzoylformate decarboxylase [Pandoraea cepalis]